LEKDFVRQHADVQNFAIILAALDSDCEVHMHWLIMINLASRCRLINGLSQPKSRKVSGLVLLNPDFAEFRILAHITWLPFVIERILGRISITAQFSARVSNVYFAHH
jgi:hypothetical protein